nr:hypothetical protein CFP56_10661 [Quercus suber]
MGTSKAAMYIDYESVMLITTTPLCKRNCKTPVLITKSINNLDIVLFSKRIGLMNMEKATSWTTESDGEVVTSVIKGAACSSGYISLTLDISLRVERGIDGQWQVISSKIIEVGPVAVKPIWNNKLHSFKNVLMKGSGPRPYTAWKPKAQVGLHNTLSNKPKAVRVNSKPNSFKSSETQSKVASSTLSAPTSFSNVQLCESSPQPSESVVPGLGSSAAPTVHGLPQILPSKPPVLLPLNNQKVGSSLPMSVEVGRGLEEGNFEIDLACSSQQEEGSMKPDQIFTKVPQDFGPTLNDFVGDLSKTWDGEGVLDATQGFPHRFSAVMSKHKEDTSAAHPVMLEESESEDEPEPLSIYRPTIELSVPMGTPIEGLFGRVKFATLAPFAATRGVFTEATTSPIGPVPIDEGTHIGKRSEEILEDPEDEPILGRRISESEEEERAPPEIEFMETFEGLGIATDIGVFAAITHAASSVPVSVVPSVPASVFPSAPITASSDKFSSSFTSSP